MTQDAATKIAARLTELWRTSLPTILERMNILRTACTTLTENPADRQARITGFEAAHKLSGVLGVFGLPQGSELASEIEFRLKSDEPLTPQDISDLCDQITDLEAIIASRESSPPTP
jgi:HPt (histidine-containing phosphotransfer) domain-containing protein